jgi:hypothetical protein
MAFTPYAQGDNLVAGNCYDGPVIHPGSDANKNSCYNERMSSLTNYISRLFLIFAFAWVVSIGTAAAQPAGRLIILRSPNFGWNLGVHLQIDGRSVANVAQGHRYDAWLPAGRHVLTVFKVPYASLSEPTSTTVNVQPGWTYVFTAMWDSNLVLLSPAGLPLSPGQVWQLRPPH